METRLIIAYGGIVLLVLIIAAVGFHSWYNARVRSVPRRRLREARRFNARMAERAQTEAAKDI